MTTAHHAAEDIPLMSREEKRRILARIVRVNALDCFDDSGAFDIAHARRVLLPGAVRHLIIHETTRTDKEGKPITQRRIHLRLVDPVSALRLDDLLERRAEKTPTPYNPNSRASFEALRRKTMAEDDEKARRLRQKEEDEEYRRQETARRAQELARFRPDPSPPASEPGPASAQNQPAGQKATGPQASDQPQDFSLLTSPFSLPSSPPPSSPAPRRQRSIPSPPPRVPLHLDHTIPNSFASQGVCKYVE